ncbi:hypothetical protein ACFFRR_008223 [Megaselia abdita]
MKFAIVFVALFAFALAAPLGEEAQIVRYDSDNDGLGGYSFNFETSDGVARQEQGHVENAGTDYETLKVSGSFQYYGDDGQLYQVQYIADENGFQPQGAHLPVA